MKVLANRVQGRVVNLGENLLYGDYKLKDKQTLSLYAYGYANGKREGIENMLNNACMNICAVKGDNQPATNTEEETPIKILTPADKFVLKTGEEKGKRYRRTRAQLLVRINRARRGIYCRWRRSIPQKHRTARSPISICTFPR